MTAIKQRADLLRALAGWNPETRLLLLCGQDESGSADLARKALAALGDPADPMALTDMETGALAAEPGRLADEAASIPMFGGRRVIRVQPATDAAAPAVELLLKAPAAGNPVLLIAGDLKAASPLRKLAEASPAALLFISYPLDARAAQQWLEGHARARGLTLDRDLNERLLALTGGDLGILANEVEKFALFLNATPEAPRRLERAHLAQLGADSAEEDVNALVSAIVTGDRRGLERQMQLLEGSSAIPALRALARRLLQLAEARAMVDAGRKPAEAIAALRPPVFWKERETMARALQQWPHRRIQAGLDACLAGERAIKTPGGPKDVAGWQAIVALGAPAERS